jgi:hypothetical protein
VSGFRRTLQLHSRALSVATMLCMFDLCPSGSVQAQPPLPYVCDRTPVEDRLPEVIAAMAGHSPVWLVEGDFGRWRGADEWVKSAWVLSRKSAGTLQVRGRRLDAPGVVSFRPNMDEPPSDVLRIPGPRGRRWSMIPGGASTQIEKDFAFIPSLMMYPSPGCWELTATLGDEEVRIVRDLKKGP